VLIDKKFGGQSGIDYKATFLLSTAEIELFKLNRIAAAELNDCGESNKIFNPELYMAYLNCMDSL